VFIDGDMTASRTYVEALVRPIESGAVGSFTKEIYLGNPENPWAEAYARIRGQRTPRLLPEDFPDRWENFRAVRREAFLGAGGYDDVGYGEDMTLAAKLGAQAVAAPGAICWHHNPASLREIFENARWIGKGHDIEHVPVLRTNHPGYALLRGGQEALAARSLVPIAARCGYHLGIWIGRVEKSLGKHHAK
jgi:GT2 family glycosyltransferase